MNTLFIDIELYDVNKKLATNSTTKTPMIRQYRIY
jgi:hypothetical protein